MLEPRRRLSALATAGLDRGGQTDRSLDSTSRPSRIPPSARGHPAQQAGSGERGPAEGAGGGGSRHSPQALPPSRAPQPSSPAGPPPPHADTHDVVTAETTRRETDSHGRFLPPARPPARAEHARTPQTQGPVWPVTPAINRSPDPALPRQEAPPLARAPPTRRAPPRPRP